jgi:hypothetical protein
MALALYICAFIIGFFSIIGIGLEIRSEGRIFRSPRFWCEVVVILATSVILFVTIVDQQRAARDQQRESGEKALAAERQAAQLTNVRNSQEAQRSTQDLQLKTQEAQLAGAKDLVKAQAEQKETLKRLIEAQSGEILLLNRLPLDRNLKGIELSFTPSRERWNAIALAYKGTVPPEQGVSYIDAPMMAEREGDHWRITFGEIKSREGNKMLGDLSTADPNNKAFEKVIDAASLGLRIEWGNATTTAFEPMRQRYPSAIYVSHDSIALILRPPLLLWNLNALNDDMRANHKPTVTFYGRDYPVALPTGFRIRSLDPAVVLDQTIPLDWKNRGKSRDPEQQMNRQVSGPHRLSIAFSRLDIFRGTSPSKRIDRHR